MTKDVFRKEQKATERTKDEVREVKELAEQLWDRFHFHAEFSPRELAIAKTHLETAVMWAVKGITDDNF